MQWKSADLQHLNESAEIATELLLKFCCDIGTFTLMLQNGWWIYGASSFYSGDKETGMFCENILNADG